MSIVSPLVTSLSVVTYILRWIFYVYSVISSDVTIGCDVYIKMVFSMYIVSPLETLLSVVTYVYVKDSIEIDFLCLVPPPVTSPSPAAICLV